MKGLVFSEHKERNERKRTILKRWANVNGSSDNGNGDSDHHSPIIMYKTLMVSGRLSFSIGDTWTEIIDGTVCYFKVLSLEDIIIPAGKYRCFKLSEEIEGGTQNHYWFASDVGLVKWEVGKARGVLQNCTL